MIKRVLSETSLNDKVAFKDTQYGAGHVVGYNKKIGKHLVAYSGINKRKSDAFSNKSGHFIQNKDNDYIYSDKAKTYEYYFFADSILELLNTEEGRDGLHAGDEIEVYCNAAGTPFARLTEWDGTGVTCFATVVGFNDIGDPIAYFASSSLPEIGNAYTTDIDRCVNGMFDGALDTSRRAFANVAAWNYAKVGKGKTIKNKNKNKEKDRPMSNTTEKPSFFEMMKGDATKAAYRVAANQMTTGVKKAILTIMEKKGQSSERIQALGEMLDTQAGQAFISTLIGMALTYAPVISNDPRAAQLADEFRINGIATAGNAMMDVAVEHFFPVIASVLSNLPAPPNAEVRVADTKSHPTETVNAEETVIEVEKTAAPKAMTA